MNELLLKRIMRAIAQGAALASAAAMVSACSTNKDQISVVASGDMSAAELGAQPDMATQPMLPAPSCAETLGTLPSAQYPSGSLGDAKTQIPASGKYTVCAARDGAARCAAPEAGAVWAQALLNKAMDQQNHHCVHGLTARYSACGPVASEPELCCYVIDLTESRCFEGRPFVVEGLARTSAVAKREGWCEVGELRGVELSASERAMVAEAWAQSGLHEHASVASFGKFMMELLSMGAPRLLVEQAAQAIQDEIAHARVCFGIAASYAGYALAPDALDITGSVMGRPDDATILAAVIAEGCIGETLSAAQVAAQAAWVEDAELKAELEYIARDEAEHAALAWGFVAWMLAKNPALVPVAERALRAGFVHPGSPAASGLTGQQERLLRHGVLPASLEADIRRDAYRAVVMQMATLVTAPVVRQLEIEMARC